jgi:hypothetical protein
MESRRVMTVLEPHDEYPHEPDAAADVNESMCLNAFDVEQEQGGWFRLGNRPDEGCAKTVCITCRAGASARGSKSGG